MRLFSTVCILVLVSTCFAQSFVASASPAPLPLVGPSGGSVAEGVQVLVTGGIGTLPEQVIVGTPVQVLGSLSVEVRGDSVTVSRLVFKAEMQKGSGSPPKLMTVSLVDQNGRTVAGPVDAAVLKETPCLLFTDTVTFPEGKSTYWLKGTIDRSAKNGDTVCYTTTPALDWEGARGGKAGRSVGLPEGSVSLGMTTVQSGELKIHVSEDPPAQNIPAGKTGCIFAKYILDATGSGEDVQFSTFWCVLANDGPLGGQPTDLTNMQLWDGDIPLNTGNNVVNPSSMSPSGQMYQFVFDKPVVVPKGTIKTLVLRGNVSGATRSDSAFMWGLGSEPADISVVGLSSHNNVEEKVIPARGQTQTVVSPGRTIQLHVSRDPSQPGNSIAPRNVYGLIFTAVRLRAMQGDVQVRGLIVEREGAADEVFTGVTLLGGNPHASDVASLGPDHRVRVGLVFTVPANTEQTVYVAGHMANDLSRFAGQTVQLKVVGIETNAVVSGELPIGGAIHTINASIDASNPIFGYKTSSSGSPPPACDPSPAPWSSPVPYASPSPGRCSTWQLLILREEMEKIGQLMATCRSLREDSSVRSEDERVRQVKLTLEVFAREHPVILRKIASSVPVFECELATAIADFYRAKFWLEDEVNTLMQELANRGPNQKG